MIERMALVVDRLLDILDHQLIDEGGAVFQFQAELRLEVRCSGKRQQQAAEVMIGLRAVQPSREIETRGRTDGMDRHIECGGGAGRERTRSRSDL